MVTKAEIDAVEWTKTDYGNSPHEYIVFRNHPGLCERLARDIATNGIYETFKGRKYRYWIFEGYKYWQIQDVINRVKV